MRGAMLSILHRFVQHDTWTKISMENGAKSDRLAAAARALSHRPAGRPPFARAAHLALSRKSKGAGGKESTESSCLLLPDAPKGAGSCSFFSWAVRLSQAAIDELCSCLPLHSPLPRLWMASQETETGRKGRDRKSPQ